MGEPINIRAIRNSPGSTVVGDEVRTTIEVGGVKIIRIYHRLPDCLLPKRKKRRAT